MLVSDHQVDYRVCQPRFPRQDERRGNARHGEAHLVRTRIVAYGVSVISFSKAFVVVFR